MHEAFVIGLGALGVAFVNLALSGDNGVMMASVVRQLPRGKRIAAIGGGAVTAIVVLITLTYTAAQLLQLPFLQSIAAVMLCWIGANVWRTSNASVQSQRTPPGFWRAIWLLVSMDVMMSTDNVLTVAAVSRGQLIPMFIGLGVSIPLVIFGSALISAAMERFPFLIWVAAAIIGRSALNLILTDDVVARLIHPSQTLVYVAQAVGAIGVVAAGKILENRHSGSPNNYAQRAEPT
jgi:YjbE family integral membrane protein